MGELDGRVALVTGSGTGLGRSMAVKLAERGADIIVNYARSASAAEETADLIRAAGAQVEVVQADVSTEGGARTLAEAAERRGRLDILINNAGITRHARNHADLDALSAQDFMDVYAVNVVGPYLVLQALKPMLVAAHAQTGRASAVLNVSSIAGVRAIGSSTAYIASKGALNSMTIAHARALGPEIRVNAICPGFIGTRWWSDELDEERYAAQIAAVEAATPLGVASGPDDIADAAIFLVTDASRHITGDLMIVDAGTVLGKTPLKK